MPIITSILILVLILAFAFVMVSAEIALLQSKTSQVSETDKFLFQMVTHKSEFLSTVQVGITISSLLAGYAGEPAMTKLLAFIPMEESLRELISFLLVTIISIVLSELLPKNVAMAFTAQTLKRVALPIKIIHIVFYPMVWLLDHSSKALSRLFGIPVINEQDDVYTQEQLIKVAQNSARNNDSDLTSVDYDLLIHAISLDNNTLEDIYTPKANISQNFDKYSRIPDDNLENYEYRRESYALNPIDVNTSLHKTLKEMIDKNTAILAVTRNNERVGIITNTDIYEQMFGQLTDEKNQFN